MRLRFIAALALGLLGAGAHAQLTNEMPDVQIMVMVAPAGGSVATVYPQEVPHAQTEARLKRLALSGWQVEGLTYEDRRLERNGSASKSPSVRKAAKELPPAPIMSSASFQLNTSVVDYAQGTLTLEPFLSAFRDVRRVNVTYLVPGQFNFRGLRQFSDNRVDISLVALEGSYTYQVVLKDHGFERLNLPLIEGPGQENARVAQNTSAPPQRLLLGTGIVALAALGIAGIAYAVSHRVLHRS